MKKDLLLLLIGTLFFIIGISLFRYLNIYEILLAIVLTIGYILKLTGF